MSDVPTSCTVTINFASPGAQPPVFVAGSFTNPPWRPQELDFVVDGIEDSASERKEYRFFAHFQLGEGQWEYKFRLGNGNWWVCDDHTETVFDDLGNENNLLVVKPSSLPSALDSGPVRTIPKDDGVGITQITEKSKKIDEPPSDPNPNHCNQFPGQKAELELSFGEARSVRSSTEKDVSRVVAEQSIWHSEATEKDGLPFRPSDASNISLELSQNEGKPQHINKDLVPLEQGELQPLLEHDTIHEGIRQRKITIDVAPKTKKKSTEDSQVSENWLKYLWQSCLSWFYSIYNYVFGSRS